ncbi:MAG TPA: hypothetical protein VIR16_05650 [Candidatus Limnocylindrales bacterium]
MGRSVVTVRIRPPSEVVYAGIERHAWSNEPSWEPEVLHVEPLAAGPIRLGARVRMTRRDFGSAHDTTYEVTRLDPPRGLAVRHVDGPLDFALDFTLAGVGSRETDVTVTVDIAPRGAMRLLTPVFALSARGRNRRIANQMVAAIEAATAAAQPSGSVATAS